jgi:hypothetical protein
MPALILGLNPRPVRICLGLFIWPAVRGRRRRTANRRFLALRRRGNDVLRAKSDAICMRVTGRRHPWRAVRVRFQNVPRAAQMAASR